MSKNVLLSLYLATIQVLFVILPNEEADMQVKQSNKSANLVASDSSISNKQQLRYLHIQVGFIHLMCSQAGKHFDIIMPV